MSRIDTAFEHLQVIALLKEQTILPVIVADDPLTCVVRGSGRALEEMDKLGTVFTND